MILYFKKRKSGEIVYYSKSNFDGAITINISDQDFKKIRQGYKLKYTNKLEIEKPPRILEAEKKADFKDKVEKAKTIAELKEIIINNI